MHIQAINIHPLIKSETEQKLMNFVSVEKQKRIRRFHFREDSLRTLFGDLLIRYCLCEYYGYKNSEISFKTNKYGKPFLENNNIKFNISHAGDWVVGVLSNYDIGIDIEKITPIDFQIAKRFFSKLEYDNLFKLPQDLMLGRFFDYWSFKESYIKARGKGLSIPLDSFSVIYDNSKGIYIEDKNYKNKVDIKQFSVDPHYKLAVCSVNKITCNDVNILESKTLAKLFLDLQNK